VNVLVVEDSATSRTRLVETLSTLQGVERVQAVASAGEASGIIQSGGPDVVVLDLHLPRDAGIGVFDLLRAAREQQAVTLVLTHDSTPRWRQTCLLAGAHFFFDKSTEAQRAIDVVAGLALGGRRRP
jgi:CheY-like chemotaxis protein